MSTRIRIAVRSTRTRSFGWSWVTAADNEDRNRIEHIRYGYAPTMPDALADAHAAALVIHHILMDEVHASRARRRVLAGVALDPITPEGEQDSGRCGGCRDLGPHRNVPACDFYEPAPTLMEATA